MFQLLNDRFTFMELKNDEKVYVDGFVFLLLHIYKRHARITAISENVPDSKIFRL